MYNSAKEKNSLNPVRPSKPAGEVRGRAAFEQPPADWRAAQMEAGRRAFEAATAETQSPQSRCLGFWEIPDTKGTTNDDRSRNARKDASD
jgi:hypothetical protein